MSILGSLKHVLRIDVEGSAPRELKKTTQAAGEMEGGFSRLGTAFAKFGLVANGVKATLGILNRVVGKSIKAFAEFDAEVGRLNNAVERAGGNQQDLSKLVEQARKAVAKYGGGITATTGAMRELLDASSDITKATEDFALAQDLASQENIDMEKATLLVAKARRGDAAALARATRLNKDLSRELNKVQDETVRSEIAIQALTDAYGGAAEANRGLDDEINSTKAVFEEAQIQFGRVATTLLTEVAGGFASTVTGAEDATTAIRTLSDDLVFFMQESGKYAEALATQIEALSRGELVGFMEALDGIEDRLARQRAAADQLDTDTKETPFQASGPSIPAAERIKHQLALQKSKKREAGARRDNAEAIRREQEAALEQFELDQAAIEQREAERAQREEIARLRLEERHMMADILELKERDLTQSEAALEMQRIQAREASRQQAAKAELAKASQLAAERAAEAEQAELALVEAARASTQAEIGKAQAFAQAGQQITSIFGEQEGAARAFAAIQGAIEAAQSAASYPDPVGIATHAAAAAQFFAVAGGVGADKKKAASGGAAPTVTAMPEIESSVKESAEMFAEALAAQTEFGGGMTSITINTRSVGKLTPEEGRELATAVQREMGRRLGGARV